MTGKDIYRVLCDCEPSIPIYSRDWWLDCVCGKSGWDALITIDDVDIEAAIPYYVPCKGIICMPPYSQTMGIWFNQAFEDKCYSRDLFRKQIICGDFIACLPAHSYFLQNFHYSFTDWLPFYWLGFRQTTHYTYVLPDIGNPDELWKGLSENIRQSIHKAKTIYQLTVRRNVPADIFLTLNAGVYQEKGTKHHQPAVLKKLIDLSRSRVQGDIWGVYDAENRLIAGAFVVWQENCAYLIAGGNDPESGKLGGPTLAIWTAINDLSKPARSFDFNGSMTFGVELLFRAFGAIQKPYFVIERVKPWLWGKIRMKFLKIIKGIR